MIKTSADIPPVVAAEFVKTRQPTSVTDAESVGYTKTKPMTKPKISQFGLPRSGKGMKGSNMRVKDTDKDMM